MKRPSITRRRFLSAILTAATLFGWELVNSLPVNAKFLHGSIIQNSGSSSSLFSLNLNNIGSNTSAAGASTETFGLVFQDSDANGLAVGTWPVLSIGGVTQSYTPFGVGYYSSGRIRRMGAVVAPSTSTAAAGNKTLLVSNGGSVPSASPRTITDFYNANFKIRAVIWSGGSSSNYVALFNLASLVTAAEIWGNGPAGLVFAAWFNFYPADGSFVPTSTTPHDRLRVKVYGHILNDASNGLGGFRLCARVCQPMYNPLSGTTAGIAMTTLQYDFNGTLVDFVLDKTARAFSAGSNPDWQTSIANPWYSGANGSGFFAGIVTVAGTTALSTSTLYFGKTSSTTVFRLSSTSSQIVNNETASSGSGATLQPVYYVGSGGSLYGLDSSWDWVYAQGTGSLASTSISKWNVNWAATADRDYFIATNQLPSFDTSLVGTLYGGTVPTNATFTYSFDVNSIGPMRSSQVDGGDRPDLGPVTQWAANDIYNPDTNSRKIIKAVAYANKGSQWCARNRANNLTIPNLAEVNGGTSFTGLPASTATTNVFTGEATRAFPLDSAFGWEDQVGDEHSPEHGYYAGLMLARPEFRDMMDEHATAAMREISGESHERNPATPTPLGGAARWYGAITWGTGEVRTPAHAMRAIFWAALAAPGKTDGTVLAPDGTNSALYWKTLADRLCSFYKALMDPTATGSITNPASANYSAYAASTGLMSIIWIDAVADGWSTPQMAPYNYQFAYFTIPMAVYVTATNNTDGRTFLQHIADWMERQRTMGPWAIIPYYGAPGQKDFGAGGNPGWPIITSDAEWVMFGMHNSNASVLGSSPYFQHDMFGVYTLSNGDTVAFIAGSNPITIPTPFVRGTRYYIRDIQTVTSPPNARYKFNLAATPGGVAITPGSLNFDVQSPFMMHVTTYPTQTTAGVTGNITMQLSAKNMYGQARQLARAGCMVTNNPGVLKTTDDMLITDNLKGDMRYMLAA